MDEKAAAELRLAALEIAGRFSRKVTANRIIRELRRERPGAARSSSGRRHGGA